MRTLAGHQMGPATGIEFVRLGAPAHDHGDDIEGAQIGRPELARRAGHNFRPTCSCARGSVADPQVALISVPSQRVGLLRDGSETSGNLGRISLAAADGARQCHPSSCISGRASGEHARVMSLLLLLLPISGPGERQRTSLRQFDVRVRLFVRSGAEFASASRADAAGAGSVRLPFASSQGDQGKQVSHVSRVYKTCRRLSGGGCSLQIAAVSRLMLAAHRRAASPPIAQTIVKVLTCAFREQRQQLMNNRSENKHGPISSGPTPGVFSASDTYELVLRL
jgi:hypothetical protein